MSTTEDTQTDDSSTESVNAEQLAGAVQSDSDNSMVSRASILVAHADDNEFYVEIQNSIGIKSTERLIRVLTDYGVVLIDDIGDDYEQVTIVGHMNPEGISKTAKVELEEPDFEALDESEAAFRKRVVENIERVI